MTNLQAAIEYLNQAEKAMRAALAAIDTDDRTLTDTRRMMDTTAAQTECHRLRLEIEVRKRRTDGASFPSPTEFYQRQADRVAAVYAAIGTQQELLA